MSEKIATREAYGKALVELGAANEQVVVLDADLAGATMTKHFKAAHPERFFDCGIAEADMVDISAGLSTTLVASSRPPSPTSSSVQSAGLREKARKAAQVVISKKVISSPPFACTHSSSSAVSAGSEISSPASRIRS